MPEVWLDLIDPVDVSTGDQTLGHIHGDGDLLRTNDGDISYLEVSNGSRFLDSDRQVSKRFQLTLEPDPTLPPESRIASYSLDYQGTSRTVTSGTGVTFSRVTTSGSETVVSTAGVMTTYREDSPRPSVVLNPSWEQLRSGGYTAVFTGDPRLSGARNSVRITMLKLRVTYELLPLVPRRRRQHPRRMWPRHDGRTGGAPRLSGSASAQTSNRMNGGYI